MRPQRATFGENYKTSVLQLVGGLNEHLSSLDLKGGELIDCKNYVMSEATASGYQSILGYERYDGTGTVSDKPVYLVDLVDLSAEPVTSVRIQTPSYDETYSPPTYVVKRDTFSTGDGKITLQITEEVAGDMGDSGLVTVTVDGTTVVDYIAVRSINRETVDFHNPDSVRLAIDAPSATLESPIATVVYKEEVYAFVPDGVNVKLYKEDATSGWVEIDTSADPMLYVEGMRYDFEVANFSADTEKLALYWADGVNRARQYDPVGGVVTITTDAVLANDKPTLVRQHQGYLALGFSYGEIVFSTDSDPTDFTTSPAVIALGRELVSLETGLEESLVIYMDKGIKLLTGRTTATFQLDTVSSTAVALKDSIQEINGTQIYVGPGGLTTLNAAETYGNFAPTNISKNFKETLREKYQLVVGSSIHYEENQYRLYFSDGTVVVVSFEGQELLGATLLEYNVGVSQISQGFIGGIWRTFMVTPNKAFVYRVDSGFNFDGEAIITRMTTAYYHYDTPRNYKGWKRCTLEMTSESEQEISVRPQYDYGEAETTTSPWYSTSVYKADGTAIWGISEWGTMVWGSSLNVTTRVPVYIPGVSVNMGYKILTKEMYREPHVIHSIITDYEILNRRV